MSFLYLGSWSVNYSYMTIAFLTAVRQWRRSVFPLFSREAGGQPSF
jgi:hypothetical protein